jgi:hypothetical protein
MAVGGCWRLTARRGCVGAALLVSRHVAVEVSVRRIAPLRGHKGKAWSPPESGRRRPPEESQIGAFTTSRAWFAAFGSRREPR